MKASEIRVGGVYVALVSGKLTNVRVDSVGERTHVDRNWKKSEKTVYHCTNLKTGRKVTFRSAAKFRGEAVQPKPKANPVEVSEGGKVVQGTNRVVAANVREQSVNPKVVRAKDRPLEALRRNVTGKVVKGEAVPVVEVGSKMTPSDFSQEMSGVLGATVDTAPHLIVEARAGTGKTTTMVEGVKLLLGHEPRITPSPQQRAVWDAILLSKGKVSTIGFVAFNRSIAAELRTRVPAGCEAMTMHGLGFKAVTRAFKLLGGNRSVNEFRVDNILEELTGKSIYDLRRESVTMVRAVKELVDLCKMNLLDGQPDDLDRLVSHFNVDVNGSRDKVYELVPKVLERCKDVGRDKYIDYADMIWLPVALGLSVQQFDLLMVDEAQDLNRCQQALAKAAGKRLILVGDPRQAIYGFAGADNMSLVRMFEELNSTDRGCTHLPLTVTRRCGKAIVEEARRIVSDFEAHESNGEGVVSRSGFQPTPGVPANGPFDYRTRAADGDMVLCRVNAPLVSECFRFIKAGRKANIQGRDVGKGLTQAVEKHWKAGTDVLAFAKNLEEWMYAEEKKELAKKNPSEARVIAIHDRYDCLMVFTDGVTPDDGDAGKQKVLDKINSIFTDDKNSPGIRLSSIHKAKGLEADRVFLLEPEGATVPHPMAKSSWQVEQEWNLRYVAITRAIKELVYVS